MFSKMRTIALDFLQMKTLNKIESSISMHELRKNYPDTILSYLTEIDSEIEKVYILKQINNVVEMETVDYKTVKHKLPFVQKSKGGAIGPVIKRTYSNTGISPKASYLKDTINRFNSIKKSNKAWSEYFQDILKIITSDILFYKGQKYCEKGKTVLQLAVESIPEKKKVFLTVENSKGKLPGESKEYQNYLSNELALIKYTTKSTREMIGTCSLCGKPNCNIYPNAIKGAGINIFNVDRIGAFPNISADNAWKAYPLCVDCADLLYIYKFHLMNNYIPRVGGAKALILPDMPLDSALKARFYKKFNGYINAIKEGENVEYKEKSILRLFAQENHISSLSIVWAKFGQNLEDVVGIINDVLPSRLNEISTFNEQIEDWRHPLFPQNKKIEFDLGMNCLREIFYRPGGKKAKNTNASKQLFKMKRNLLSTLYHDENLGAAQFDKEFIETAKWYMLQLFEAGKPYSALYEGKESDKSFTLAGWIRNFAFLKYYLKTMGVFKMGDNFYEPEWESLKPYFGKESGIDTKEKAFAFLLGILYGKIMQVQGAKRVNVGANALTWLKRLTLTGKDLPELYVKIREKLLAYETESNENVRKLVREIGQVGVKLGNKIELDKINTNYFLLLGQSITTTVLPKKEN